MTHRRRRIRKTLLWVIAAILALAGAYVIGLPQIQARGSSLLKASDLYVPRLIDVVVVTWCFWVGSAVGSFLNVVAWRMPRGESINGRSHCPRCCAQLQARDNFPVFGWLALGGRCRTCRLPISSRYPLVEALVGTTITMVAVAELYGLSLPRQHAHWHGGPFWAPVVDSQVLLTMLFHTVGLAVCWAFGLIRMDHHRLPSRLILFGFAVTVVPMCIYPTLMVVPWRMEVAADWQGDGQYLDALARVITAVVAATIQARYLARALCPTADPKLDPLGCSTARLIDLIAILAVPAILVGWQASCAVTVMASLIAVALRPMRRAGVDSLGRFAIAMPLALTIQLVFWRHLHAHGPDQSGGLWPSDGGSPWVILGWAGLVMLIPLWLHDRSGPPEPTELLDVPSS